MTQGNKMYQGHTVDHVLAILQKLSDQGKGDWDFRLGQDESMLGVTIEADVLSEHSPRVLLRGYGGEQVRLLRRVTEEPDPTAKKHFCPLEHGGNFCNVCNPKG